MKKLIDLAIRVNKANKQVSLVPRKMDLSPELRRKIHLMKRMRIRIEEME